MSTDMLSPDVCAFKMKGLCDFKKKEILFPEAAVSLIEYLGFGISYKRILQLKS